MKPGCMRACMHRPAVLPRGRQPAARLPWLCLEGTVCRGIPWVEGVGVNCLLVGSRGLHPVHRNCSTSKLVQDSAREGAVRMIDREAMVLRAGQRPGRRRRRCSVARRLAEELSSRTICSASGAMSRAPGLTSSDEFCFEAGEAARQSFASRSRNSTHWTRPRSVGTDHLGHGSLWCPAAHAAQHASPQAQIGAWCKQQPPS